MREDFEAAQARICEFKSLLDGRLPRSQRGVVAMYGGSRGGGLGDGHSGSDRGGAGDSAGRGHDTSDGCSGGHGRGRGGGAGRGNGGGRSGDGRGNSHDGHGRRRTNFPWDHVNSKGRAALD